MGLFKRAKQGRARWLIVFTLLLLTAGSVPVLADPPAEEQAPAGESESGGEFDPALLPDAEDLAKAEEQLEEAEAEQAQELEAPAAIAEREESTLAYTDLESAAAVIDLLRSSFAEELATLDQDPARVLTDATLKRNLGNDGGAVVSSEGEPELIEAAIPAEVEDEDGELEKVDLSLDATPEGFEPENPATDILIPTSPTQAVSIEEGEISITQVGADPESRAHAFGEKDVIYPDVQTDTDLLVSPLSSGVELFDQLRSPESPETLSFQLDIPAGAELRANGGAAEVWEDEQMTGLVTPPRAVDAQGTEVPVTMEVQGKTIVLDVPHREGEYAYPILVDPQYSTQNNWSSNSWEAGYRYDVLEDNTFGTWNNNPGTKASKWCPYTCWGSGRGLFISFPSNGYGFEQVAQWYYWVPGETSFLTGYLINPFRREDHPNCPRSKFPEPHDFDGLWSPTYNIYYQLYTNRAPYGNASIYGNTAQTAKVMVFGLNSGNGVSLPCWRDIYAGGVATYMSDPENPTLDSLSGQPSGWFDDSKQYGVNVAAHDPGLGVDNIEILNAGPAIYYKNPSLACHGTHDQPCPRDIAGTIPFNGDNFDEGVQQVEVVAHDALTQPSNIRYFWIYVDSTGPELSLSGQLASATEEAGGNGKDPKEWDDLSLPTYNLTVKAKDGNPKFTSDKERRSGVKDIEIWLDGTEQTVPWSPKASPCENCEMTQTYPLKMEGLAAGKHMLKVFGVDQMGHRSERDIEFEYIPATGMRDEYVMQRFPLPDGQGKEAEEEHPTRPELAVNVMNGNLAYREKDVDVPGYAADLEVERFYNSQLPNSANTEWGDGWTLAQTPELEPEAGATPKEAQLIDTSGALEDEVQLPTEVGKTKFDPGLQATVTKEAGGGYELADNSGETATSIAFDASGRTDELRTEGYAKVDYDYEAGKLDKIAVKDPGSASGLSEAEEEALEYVPPAPTYKSAFGTYGTGDGQLSRPADMALATNGDLFVVDRVNNRIQRFNQEGKYVSKFGAAGAGNGQFKSPSSIAIDASGSLYVADTGNNRIQKFTEAGTFVKAVGTVGAGDGQFKEPEGIAIDAKGNVLVADTRNQRIQKLNPALEFISKFGSSGTGNGQFNQVNSIDVGPGGTIWVVDWNLNRVTEFNEAGGFVQKFGASGSGNGQFSNPFGIEVDSRGNVYVGDENNRRVQVFNQAGKYLTQFGSSGTGGGQFTFLGAMGMAVDNKGGLWVTDNYNNRIQKWGVPNYRPSWYGAFGTVGTGDGQMKTPADTAIAPNGDVFVLDKGNARILRFNREGKYLSKFGTAGTGNGQLKAPTSIAIDGSNNLWVTDAGNYRIQEFTEGGEFVRVVGSQGTGNAQFSIAEGIATDLKGNVYVADTYNRRIQVFDEEGKYLFKFGSAGSGLGKFTEANAVDVGRHGNVYVADWGANKIQVFNEKGEAVLQFGSAGSGEGQFNHADAVEADEKGNVWIGDQSNGRIELFNEAGEYLTQFGTKGSGEGQFSFTYPMGVTADPNGGLWITDVSNNRIQKWQVPSTDPPKPPEENDPSVDVGLSSGLVSSVEGDEAGVNTYAHTGELLIANKGPDGETKYEYDAQGRLKKVTLPNGTYGSITYNTTYGRVSKVTVDPAGAAPAKSTGFSYSDEPRRTTVTPEGARTVTYDIGADGSVLKWQDAKKPPTIENISGTLYASRGKEVNAGLQNVFVKASSPQGISAIQIVANGTDLVDEKACTENIETEAVECSPLINEWVMETENFSPGLLNLEVIVEDRTEEVAAERFWVNIPPPPPPAPAGLPVTPKFKDILNFRENFGLEVWDPVNDETELNDRIFALINAWKVEDPVARGSWERWGVPLRPQDIAEMEYRENYVAHDGAMIEEWAGSHASNDYAGYYLDHRAGGIIHVGFTQNQDGLVSQLKQEPRLMASSRIATFAYQPPHSAVSLEALQHEIAEDDATQGPLAGLIVRVGTDIQGNVVKVGALDPSVVASGLKSTHGTSAPIVVYQESPMDGPLEGHFNNDGPLRPGIAVGRMEENIPNFCTLGFGAAEKSSKVNQATGRPIIRNFALVTGHCWNDKDKGIGFPVKRFRSSQDKDPIKIGTVARRSNNFWIEKHSTDGAAILLEGAGTEFSPSVFRLGATPRPITGTIKPIQGMVVHKSAVSTKTRPSQPGEITGPAEEVLYISALDVGEVGPYWLVPTDMHGAHGDSGGPIWTQNGLAVGLVAFGGPDHSAFSPLLHPELPGSHVNGVPIGPNEAPGVLNAPGMGNDLYLRTAP